MKQHDAASLPASPLPGTKKASMTVGRWSFFYFYEEWECRPPMDDTSGFIAE